MGFAGIDTSSYPGNVVMQDLWDNTNLSWCGFYLGPAPSHPGTSWMTHRAELVAMGWGLAPLYVGRQTAGAGSHDVTQERGTEDGVNACALANAADFPVGTVIYLDIETGGPLAATLREYLVAWAAAVVQGGYTPGLYCSFQVAAAALAAVPGLRIWTFKLLANQSNTNHDPPFREDDPTASGVATAVAWQWAQQCTIPTSQGPLIVDLDVASVEDPSEAI